MESTRRKLLIEGDNGEIPFSTLNQIIESLVFSTTSAMPPEEKKISLTAGDANYLPETEHYYEYVPDLGIRWDDARDAAEQRDYFGLQGYLATITSAAEAQLTGEQAAGAGWIGGTDETTEGVWQWVTGPEAEQLEWRYQWYYTKFALEY